MDLWSGLQTETSIIWLESNYFKSASNKIVSSRRNKVTARNGCRCAERLKKDWKKPTMSILTFCKSFIVNKLSDALEKEIAFLTERHSLPQNHRRETLWENYSWLNTYITNWVGGGSDCICGEINTRAQWRFCLWNGPKVTAEWRGVWRAACSRVKTRVYDSSDTSCTGPPLTKNTHLSDERWEMQRQHLKRCVYSAAHDHSERLVLNQPGANRLCLGQNGFKYMYWVK